MPARPAHDTLQRLIALLKAIPHGSPGKSTKDLSNALKAEGFDVHARSVQRDLDQLAQAFPITCDDSSKPFQWYWTQRDALGITSLSTPEALALALVEQHLKQALPGNMASSFASLFAQAHAKLEQMGPNNRQPRWLSKVRTISPILPTKCPGVDPGVHATVAEALMNDRQLEVEYKSTTRDDSKRVILNPLGLILRGPTLYLAATAEGHADVRLYVLHRIRRATELARPAAIPRGFDIDRCIEDGLGQFGAAPLRPEKLKLVLLCDGWLARQLEESPLSSDQRITKRSDGRVQVSATVVKSWQLQWWLLARLESVEVLAPTAYRNEIADLLERGFSRYKRHRLKKAA